MDAILQARVSSNRLPAKVLMPILGRSITSLTVERLLNARTIDRVIVATTTSPEDDAIQSLCEAEGINCFRGSEEDVLDRIYRCAQQFNLEIVAKFTADNPLIDPLVIDKVIDEFFASPSHYDYLSNNHPPTWQDGQEVEIFRLSALERAWAEGNQPFHREHVTPFIWDQTHLFRVGNIEREDDNWYHTYRWTLDYREDYEFIKSVFEELYPSNPNFTTEDVMALLVRCPEIYAINANRIGYVWYDEHKSDLKTINDK